MTELINYFAELGFSLMVMSIVFVPVAVAIWVVENHMPESWKEKISTWVAESDEE